MQKPNDYESVQGYGEYTPIEDGGHYLVIKKVEEKSTRNGGTMLTVSFDMDKNDRQAGYYTTQYKNDKRNPKKWGGVTYVFPFDKEGNTSRQFKTFCTCVEHSNNAKIAWGAQFNAWFAGKKVGGTFGKEEYMGNDGKVHKATKLFWFNSTEAIANGVEIPKERTMEPMQQSFANNEPLEIDDDFSLMADDDDIPF